MRSTLTSTSTSTSTYILASTKEEIFTLSHWLRATYLVRTEPNLTTDTRTTPFVWFWEAAEGMLTMYCACLQQPHISSPHSLDWGESRWHRFWSRPLHIFGILPCSTTRERRLRSVNDPSHGAMSWQWQLFPSRKTHHSSWDGLRSSRRAAREETQRGVSGKIQRRTVLHKLPRQRSSGCYRSGGHNTLFGLLYIR